MHDFIAIGDTVIDAFIKLKDATVHCDIDKEHCTISMAFGDKIPYESVEEVVAVGNSANAAVAASRLGLNTALVTNLGADDNGKKCLEKLKEEKVSTDFVKTEVGKKTNYHYVLWYEDDRTILIKHEEFNYKLPDLGPAKWLYLSSLGENSLAYHDEVLQYLEVHPETKLAFQPGTFQLSLGAEKLKKVYEKAEIVFSNVAEAEKILGINTLGIEELLKRMHALGPKITVITDGPKGAYAYDGEKIYKQLPYPDPKPPLDRTGAGDAFSSTIAVALAMGLNLEMALKWGAINSMSVVQYVGAQKGLLTKEEIEEYLKSAF